MVAIRQVLLVVHYRNNCRIRRHAPTKKSATILAIAITLAGLTFIGIPVAVAVHAGAGALAVHDATRMTPH